MSGNWRSATAKPAKITSPTRLNLAASKKLQLKETTAQPEGERANLRVITQNRQALSDITAILPDGNKVMMSSLRQFSGTQPLYTLDGDGTLTNNQSGVKYRPNNQIGFLPVHYRRRQLGR